MITDFPAPTVTTIARAARWAAEQYEDRPALVDQERVLSFRQYVEAAHDVARGLVAAGTSIGDRVAIWAPNSIDWAVTALGIHIAGAALVPINTRFTVREAAGVLQRSGARVVMTVDSFLSRDYAQELRDIHIEHPGILPQLPRIVLLTEDADHASLIQLRSEGRAVSHEEMERRTLAIEQDDIGTALFTSGTTGAPKGVMLSHGALLRAYWNWGQILGVRPGDRVLLTNPFFHAFGLKVGLLLSLTHGVTAYPMAIFNATQALDVIERERITFYPAPPTVFQSLLAEPSLAQRDLASLRIAVTGATSIPPQLIHEMFDVLGFQDVFSPYGFTEATGVATVTRREDTREAIATTAGRPVPGVEVAIMGSDGQLLENGETGEIVVRGYNIMKRYLGSDETVTDEQGYLHSGDLGTFDDAGNLRVTGRLKDMIIVGGFNVYPSEVEAVLTEHPEVRTVAVTSAPDKRLGEVGVAYVVRHRDSKIAEADLKSWCEERLANYKQPRRYYFVDALPTNASGKVIKQDLSARLAMID